MTGYINCWRRFLERHLNREIEVNRKVIMSKLTVVAKITAKNDAIEELRKELLKLITPTRKEAGCIEYNLYQNNENPAVFIFYETWESPEHLEKHMNTEHFNSYVNAVVSMVEEKEVHKMTRIE